MSRNKLVRFAEMATFPNVIQPDIKKLNLEQLNIKGTWNSHIFKNHNPIVLELGCGKGEYTIALAQHFQEQNFIGIDIKGSRMYVGAKFALNHNLKNVRFLRIKIEFIEFFFEQNEVQEIWLTFPDPQPKKRWTKKRLTSSVFQNRYFQVLNPNGLIHLKTDNLFLYYYTLSLLQQNNVEILLHSNNLYNSHILTPILEIRTYYEQQYINQGFPITYICWKKPSYQIKELCDEKYEEIEKYYHRSHL